jgi:DNA-binding NarL/FixJ family response regulator
MTSALRLLGHSVVDTEYKEPPSSAIICDQDPFVRAGVRTALEHSADITVVGEAVDGADVARLMALHNASVVIFGDREAAEVFPKVTGDNAAFDFVVLADNLEVDQMVTLLRSGVRGIVYRAGSRRDLVQAVHSVAKGGGFIAPRFVGPLLAAIHEHAICQHGRHAEVAGLTARERAVLDLLCQGMTNLEIASDLHLSVKTVKSHVSNVLVKMKVRNRARLIANVVQSDRRPALAAPGP